MKRLKWVLLLALTLCALTVGAFAADGYTLYGVTIGQGEVSVTLEAEADCLLMVAVYDNSGVMRSTQGKSISGNENYQIISVPFFDEVLANGFAKAFLLDNDTLSPLCSSYDSNTDGNVFAILYDDGEMVFQHGNTLEAGRISNRSYPVNLMEGYHYFNGPTTPWYVDGQFLTITKIRFADYIQPAKTSYWFAECRYINEIIDIENLDTSRVTDMSNMFHYCVSLTMLDVAHFDTSKVTNMDDMFSSCRNLMALDVSCFDTSHVTDMRGMFYGCSELKELDVSHFDTSQVTNMRNMFWNCCGLTILDVSQFKTDNVISMYKMFGECSRLTSLDISHFNTNRVTDMDYMFRDCSGLTALDLSSFNTSKVTDMHYMFAGCSGLTTLDLSPFNTSKVIDMSCMFGGCTNLSTIRVSDSFATDSVADSRSMFYNCTSLAGGAGTKYDSEHTDAEYARIDGGPSAPGYFTLKTA